MKALAWHGREDIRCESVPDPEIEQASDVIIRVTACAICGSDLHIYNGVMPGMETGDVLGHETMGEVVETGSEVSNLKVGDRVVVPFTIACGECFFCKRGFYSACERTNPDKEKAEKLWGHSPAGLFGYTHLLATLAARRNIFVFPMLMSGPSRCPKG
jgi:threonine dehydrogenase-like Zn-dependent dehydrogenase